MTNARYGKTTAGLIGAWFLSSLSASALKVFEDDSARPPLALGLAVLTPIVLLALWYAASAGFRQFALTLNPRTFTIVQTWRIGGFVFLVLHAHGILPGVFALPAGLGDIVVGATAPFVVMKLAYPEHRKAFILWQILGMSDLVMAVSLGMFAGVISPDAIRTGAMTVLPMSLIPTFAVPLLITLHIICIAQARRWPERRYSRADEQPASSRA
jgi:hypothetical protein